MGIIKEGSVKLEFSIGTDGQAKNIEIVESSHTALESPAIEAITKTRFSPAVRNGQVTEIRLSQILTFTDPSEKKE